MQTKLSRTKITTDIQCFQSQAIVRIVKIVGCIVTPDRLAHGKSFGPGELIIVARIREQRVSLMCPCHRSGCRPARPRCRRNRDRNPKWTLCHCGLLHYPHRIGSCKKIADEYYSTLRVG